MDIAVFAGKSFSVSAKKIYTFSDFTTSSSLQIENQDVVGKKSSSYIKGADLGTMSFSIPLNVSYGVNVRTEYEAWRDIAEGGKPYPFILGGKPFGPNKWLLKSANLSNTSIDNKGVILSGALQLEFQEYVRAGSAKASKSKTPGVSSLSSNEYNSLSADIFGADKAGQKRDNPNAKAATVRGPLDY